MAVAGSEQYEPGQWARRFARLRWTRAYPLASTTVAVVVGIPLGFAIESAGDKLSWSAAAIGVGLLCTVLCAWGLSIRQFTKWQRENGSVFFLSMQEGNDLDLDRVAHAIESHPIDLFDGPLIKRNDAVGKSRDVDTLIPTLARNTENLLKSGDRNTPKHLIANLRWDHAIGFGWCLPRDGCDFVLWHLVTNPKNDFPDYQRRPLRNDTPIELLGRSLVDVIDRSMLADLNVPGYPQLAEGQPRRPGLQPAVGELNNNARVATLAFAMPELPTAPEGGFDRTISWADRPGDTGIWPAGAEKKEEFNDPRNFGALSLLVAEEIHLGVRHAQRNHQRLRVAARLPKPVAVAVGWLLSDRYGLTAKDMAFIDFGLYGGEGQPLRFQPLFPSTPARPSNLVNLTSHEIVVLDQNDAPIATIGPSGTIARLIEDATPGESVAVTFDSDVVAIPTRLVRYGSVHGLPQPDGVTSFIVSLVTAEAFTGRSDLLYPHDEVRDAAGRIVGVRNLARLDQSERPRHAD